MFWCANVYQQIQSVVFFKGIDFNKSNLGLGTGLAGDASDGGPEEQSTHLLDLYVPGVVETYIGARLKLLAALHTEPDKHHGITNPLEDSGVLETHLQHIPMICRFQVGWVSKQE